MRNRQLWTLIFTLSVMISCTTTRDLASVCGHATRSLANVCEPHLGELPLPTPLPNTKFESDVSKKVRRLQESETGEYTVVIKNGLFYNLKGELFDTEHGRSLSRDQWQIFVLDTKLQLVTIAFTAVDRIHHSTLAGFGSVYFAGEWTIKKGRLVGVSDRSGHYLPGLPQLLHFLSWLDNKGVDISNLELDLGQIITERILPGKAWRRDAKDNSALDIFFYGLTLSRKYALKIRSDKYSVNDIIYMSLNLMVPELRQRPDLVERLIGTRDSNVYYHLLLFQLGKGVAETTGELSQLQSHQQANVVRDILNFIRLNPELPIPSRFLDNIQFDYMSLLFMKHNLEVAPYTQNLTRLLNFLSDFKHWNLRAQWVYEALMPVFEDKNLLQHFLNSSFVNERTSPEAREGIVKALMEKKRTGALSAVLLNRPSVAYSETLVQEFLRANPKLSREFVEFKDPTVN